MAESNRILVRKTPTIKPNLFEYSDVESSKASQDNRKLIDGKASGFQQRAGLMEPLVMVGSIKLMSESLKSLTIWQDDLVPTISLTFVDSGYVFTSRGYPLANIIVSIFVQSPIKKLKSMAADFLITNISSMPIPNSASIVYTLSGELNVPFLYGNYSKAFRNLTSIQVMQKVAEDLQLGFADNQPEGTNDLMTWIMPNYTYKSFLTHISKFAYRDDNNFFDCFIDRYYILNFVNVEKQFSRDEEIDKGWQTIDQTVIDKRRINPEEDKLVEVEVPIILTNYPTASDTEFYITDFSIDSNHGEIIKKNAVRRYIYWYEHGANHSEEKTNDANYRIHFTEPITSTVTKDGKLPHTITMPEYTSSDEKPDDGPKISTNIWSGIDYSNAHASYKFAELLNHHNWLETEKNILNVTLSGFSVNLLRGSRVRVDIFLDKYSATMANAMAKDSENDPPLNVLQTGEQEIDGKLTGYVKDVALSDFYYVRSIVHSYINGKFETKLTLSRRHWVLPVAKNRTIV